MTCFDINEGDIRGHADIPKDTPKEFLELAFWCLKYEPKDRPDFGKIITILEKILNTMEKGERKHERKHSFPHLLKNQEWVNELNKKRAKYNEKMAKEEMNKPMTSPLARTEEVEKVEKVEKASSHKKRGSEKSDWSFGDSLEEKKEEGSGHKRR